VAVWNVIVGMQMTKTSHPCIHYHDQDLNPSFNYIPLRDIADMHKL